MHDLIHILSVVTGPNSEAAEQSLRAHEKFRKSAEEACMSQGEAEDLEDELAQIKAEIKKLMHEVADLHYMKCI